VLSAIAAGPCFTILCTKLTELFTRKKLVPDNTIQLLAKISGGLLTLYMILKIADTFGWYNGVVKSAGLTFGSFYREGPYGVWMFWLEIVVCGVVPAILLMVPAIRKNGVSLIVACLLTCTGVVLNRFSFIVVTLAIPVMRFDRFWSYMPTWQEWGIALAVVGYGFLLFSAAYRYLPVFPKEKDLNPAPTS